MTLESNLVAAFQAIGADIKQLRTAGVGVGNTRSVRPLASGGWPTLPARAAGEYRIFYVPAGTPAPTAADGYLVGTDVYIALALPPTPSFTKAFTNPTVNVDASASSNPQGGALTYAWDFGDGGTATGVTASHTYTATGTWTIKLTVANSEASAVATDTVTTYVAGVVWSDEFSGSAVGDAIGTRPSDNALGGSVAKTPTLPYTTNTNLAITGGNLTSTAGSATTGVKWVDGLHDKTVEWQHNSSSGGTGYEMFAYRGGSSYDGTGVLVLGTTATLFTEKNYTRTNATPSLTVASGDMLRIQIAGTSATLTNVTKGTSVSMTTSVIAQNDVLWRVNANNVASIGYVKVTG